MIDKLKKLETEDFEIGQFLEAIYYRHGYDFRDYSKASLKRRIRARKELSGFKYISEMTLKVLHDPDFFNLFLKDMSITVTEMFRDPWVFSSIREQVFKILGTYSRINIWHAGCATGEEVYSMAIMLKEAGLLDRTRIYATDFNNHSLALAKKGVYPVDNMKLYTKNYQEAGGLETFSNYFTAKYNSVKVNDDLKKNITFAHHNLMKDQVFAEMHLILCRNVMIYFEKPLQNRVLKVFLDSLVHRCYLVLGDKETLDFSDVRESFDVVDDRAKVYRRASIV